jgi:hypothetical protein
LFHNIKSFTTSEEIMSPIAEGIKLILDGDDFLLSSDSIFSPTDISSE